MFPVDTLKTRMQAIGPSSCSSSTVNLRQSLGSILKLEGPAGLYRGIAAMGLGAGPAHAVYFSVYEWFKKSLSAVSYYLNFSSFFFFGRLVTVPLDCEK